MMLPMALDPDAVVIILDKDGNVIDETYNWETAENIAMHEFDCANAIALLPDGWYDTTEKFQAMLDRCLRDRLDCFGE